jgi:hypothetical protein
MGKIHVVTIARQPAFPLLASPPRALRRVSLPRAWIRMEGALGVFTAPPHGLVLLKGLSGVLLDESAEVHRHG